MSDPVLGRDNRAVLNALLDGVEVEVAGRRYVMRRVGQVVLEGDAEDLVANETGVFLLAHRLPGNRVRPMLVADTLGALLTLVGSATEADKVAAAAGSALRKMAKSRGPHSVSAPAVGRVEGDADERPQGPPRLSVVRWDRGGAGGGGL